MPILQSGGWGRVDVNSSTCGLRHQANGRTWPWLRTLTAGTENSNGKVGRTRTSAVDGSSERDTAHSRLPGRQCKGCRYSQTDRQILIGLDRIRSEIPKQPIKLHKAFASR